MKIKIKIKKDKRKEGERWKESGKRKEKDDTNP